MKDFQEAMKELYGRSSRGLDPALLKQLLERLNKK